MGSKVTTFWSRDTDRSLYPQLQRGQRGYVHPRTFKSSSTSCFQYFAIIKFKDKWQKNAPVVVHLLAGSGTCTWSKPIKAKIINLSTSFLFFNSFLILKRNSTAATGVVLLKKLFLKGSEYSQKNTCVAESLFDKAAGLQDCCKTCLLHAHLRSYFSFGKNSSTFCKLCFFKKCQI